MKGQLIGQGNTAEVFAWGENQILKLFRSEFSNDGIEREYYISREVEKLDLPVPKTGQMIELEGRKGICYDRAAGKSMLDQFMSSPFSIGKISKQLAKLHHQIHQCKVQGFPNLKNNIRWNINHTQLTDKQKEAVINILDHLPEDNTLCHSDFNPGNIITDFKKSVIIDWGAACAGCPSADVARTLMLLRDAVLPEYIPEPMKLAMNVMRHRLAKLYLKHYKRISGITEEEIGNWRIPLIAARLNEWIPDKEKTAILHEIDRAVANYICY
jgi:uncharacterized protein (TIGR02172 family)